MIQFTKYSKWPCAGSHVGACAGLARVFLCAFMTLAYASAIRGADNNVLAEFEMAFDEERAAPLIIPVDFGGNSYRFEIDTGSANTTFDERLVRLLSRPTGTALVHAPGGTRARELYRAPTGSIGALRLPLLDSVGCRKLNSRSATMTHPIDGILGADALRTCLLMLDFDKAKVLFLREAPPRPGVRVAMAPGVKVPAITAVLPHCGVRNFIIDTGYNGEIGLPNTDFAALVAHGRILLAGSRTVNAAAGSYACRLGVLDGGLSVAGHTHVGVAVVELPDSTTPLTSIGRDLNRRFHVLGLDYLSRYIVTFDFPHSAVYLRPSGSFHALRAAARLGGIRLERQGDNVVISSVRERSEAAAVARQKDVLESINGAPAARMADCEVVRLLTDAATDRKVVFRRPSDGSNWWMVVDALPSGPTAIAQPEDTERGFAPDAFSRVPTPNPASRATSLKRRWWRR